MTTFIGDYKCRLDSKGRFLLPSAFKKQMSQGTNDHFVIKKDLFENCLVMYPMEEWERQNKIIRRKTNPYNRQHNDFLRRFFKGTAEVVLDANNRILIPRRLLEAISADKEVVLAGQFGKIEIWSGNAYDKLDGNDEDIATLAENIMGGELDETD